MKNARIMNYHNYLGFWKAHTLKRNPFFIPISIIVLGLLMNSVPLEAQSWEFVGRDTFSKRKEALDQDIAFKPSDGTPYVAYTSTNELRGSLGITVKKFNGNEWVTVGSETFTAEETSEPDLTFSSANNQPYIIYSNDEDKPAVRTFNGNKWAFVGPNQLDSDKILPPEIVFGSGTPYIIYGERLGGINVRKYNGNRWVYVGKENFFSTGNVYAYEMHIAIDPTDGTPYITHLDRPSNFQSPHPTVKKFNGNKWVTVGEYNFTDSIGSKPDLAFKPNKGAPYIAYNDETQEEMRITVEKFDGNKWVPVGNKRFPEAESGGPEISFLPSTGTPYLAYFSLAAGTNNLTVQKFNGNQWKAVGNNPITADIEGFSDFGVSPVYENLFVAYSNTRLGGKTSVLTYETSTSTGSPDVSINSPSIRIYPNPAQNKVKIQTRTQTQTPTYNLHTLSGKEVQSGHLRGKGPHSLDVNNRAPGVYLLQVKSEEDVCTKRVMVK